MPVWHVSISLHTPDGDRVNARNQLEAIAVDLLRGVGGASEWWLWNRQARVGHLRVAVTFAENAAIPLARVLADAGPSGPKRRRTR